MSGFDETFDWVVVGSGAGSMASALVMRQAGKSVLILEKTEFVGGTTAKSGGVMWIPNNRFMAADGEKDSVAEGIKYLDAVCEDLPGSSHEKRLTYVNEGSKMIDFLVAEKKLSREDAYMLCSVAGDLHVTQAVDATKGVHMMLPKSIFK